MKGSTMKYIKLASVIVLFVVFANNAFAGDKEDVVKVVNTLVEAFNKQDFKTYFSNIVNDNTSFPYVVSPLRHDANMWRNFIEGTASLAYVNYHQQDTEVQIYNGNTAIVTGYYTFSWMEKGGQMNYQSGRASTVLVKQDGKWMAVHQHFSAMF
jgi:ketosteroid isomerase-like protein